MSNDRDIERGRLAGDVLANPVYQDSYALVEQGLTRKWRDSRDKAEREELHQLLRMLNKARTVLEATMRNGQVATKELERKQSLAERIGQRFQRD